MVPISANLFMVFFVTPHRSSSREPVTLLIFPAKSSTFKRICHPDRSEAQWRDLLFLFRFSHRIVILSAAPHRLIARHSTCGAESKDLGGASLTHAVRSFSATGPDSA